MAGSYKHAVDDDGNLLPAEDTGIFAENYGDAYETVEEMYGMIWFLAATHTGNPVAAVEEARQNYKAGLAAARRLNGGSTP